ncbi:MAG TPA: AarF/UbiB family protein [Ilumatobacteraceae bacterium]|nr:AarF/UbiB family protein [Ilumatobacteraceae bacterium]
MPRYRGIASLLIKQWRSGNLTDFDPDAPVSDDPSVAADAQKLVEDLESMGPTFIKLGQLLSTRADLLPSAYIAALSRLQDDVVPIPYEEIAATVSSEIGARLSKAFQFFDAKPAASASLGQVHRAVLRDGRPVAVKVQRPGVREQVIEDMAVIEELAAFVDQHTAVGRNYGFGGMVEEFRRSIMAELDYRLEAANLRQLAANLVEYDRIFVPQPIDDYSTSLVLTMEFVAGRNIGSLGPLAQQEIDGQVLAEQLFRSYLDQVLVDGFFHADPHPGNILLTDDGRLALIDLGMVAHIGGHQQDMLIRLLLALSRGQGGEVAEVMAELGDKRDGWDRQRFDRAICELVEQHRGVSVGQIESGRVLADIARIAVDCGLQPPAELTMLSKALLNLDQIVAKLDPDFEPDAAIQEHAGKLMRSKIVESASPSNLLTTAMDVREFVERLPRRVNKVMDALAEGELRLDIHGIDEKELMRGVQKLANRLTTGLVIAALIVGAAMLTRIETKTRLFGYPALAIVCFLLAAFAGLWLILSSVLHDLPQRRRRRHR